MRLGWLKSKGLSLLVGAVLPLYILLSFSAILCSFHHMAEGEVKESHHHASKNSDSKNSSGSPLDFCKYAQSASPVIHTSHAKKRVSFQPVAQVLLGIPSSSSKENIEEVFLRGPPLLINL